MNADGSGQRRVARLSARDRLRREMGDRLGRDRAWRSRRRHGGAGKESSAPPPVARVAGELVRSGARVCSSSSPTAGKEYVATAGARRPEQSSAFA